MAGVTDATVDVLCMACSDQGCDFKPATFARRKMGAKDITIDVLYCGVCHSDLHHAANHNADIFGETPYPCVPGHEIAGICVAAGDGCSKIKVGMRVGVGCFVASCLDCPNCMDGEEQKCSERCNTYGSKDKTGLAASPIGWTIGDIQRP